MSEDVVWEPRMRKPWVHTQRLENSIVPPLAAAYGGAVHLVQKDLTVQFIMRLIML